MSRLGRDLTLLAEPLRVRILGLLAEEELGVGELTRVLESPQSTISRHLKALQNADWVTRRAEGTSGWFRLAELDADAAALWKVVDRASCGTRENMADMERLAGVLAARATREGTFFGRMHSQWDALRRELFGDAFTLPAMLALVPEAWTIADLGCGTGLTVAQLSTCVHRVIGVDQEPAMLQAAAARTQTLPNVELRQGGMEQLPLADGEVDAAICMLVLHHVTDLQAAFQEMRRVLRPNGKVVILDIQPHEREHYRDTMGHKHLGFDAQTLERLATASSLRLGSWRSLSSESGAQGPPLFLAVLHG
jgi:ArsR family transcriptional regulator